MLKYILQQYNLSYTDYAIETFGSGLINKTWKLTERFGNNIFILQQINKSVFKTPTLVTDNINKLGAYLSTTYPNYLFASLIPSLNGSFAIMDTDGEYYKLSKFIDNSITINTVNNYKQAFEAAYKFAEFTYLLNGFNSNELNYTLEDFHNLNIRFKEFEKQVALADEMKLNEAKDAINEIYKNKNIVDTYQTIVSENILPIRAIHHDTKINNILFDEKQNGLCVIDLDTVMPGYYISDVGDMLRTYLCTVNEEEKDLTKIEIREDLFEAIAEGYFKGMGKTLTVNEKKLFVYAGNFLIYMQSIRFLTDYLANDVYYGEKYPGHNLVRAKNQLQLLNKYKQLSNKFEKIVSKHLEEVVS